ncbi:MAG TPA: D-alanine--D-alanine ligase family protein [Deltaproteobacteria bacterium]|nr:D-alanine--D-alanine ligase family protein [Deltaproteobacteria bacterium]HPR54253.1 D-alanine--D-alanine ligase family protein [Deltaproteobacteria bacterium]HXK45835.1 D-alanine--D-alanine ligase family protein [Deltaproteobacteria bacterium]
MSSHKTRVAVIFGGVSTEHDVSVVSASSIAQSMDTQRFDPVYVGIDKNGRWLLGQGAFEALRGGGRERVEPVILSTDPQKRGFLHLESGRLTTVDVIFPVLHGPRGEDGTIQGLFELAGIAYVGCDTMSSAIAMDKDITKRVLAQRGIPVVKGTCVTRWMWDTDRDEVLREIEDTLSFPLFIKPATMGSSIGVTKAMDMDAAVRGLDYALGFSTKAVVEQSVENALEVEVAVLGNNEPKASVPGQVIPSGEFYDFDAKYIDNASELIIPAKISKAMSDDIQFAAVDAFVAIGGSGMARIDFLVSPDTFYLNEINPIPGFTGISMYPKLWEATGIPYVELIGRLIDLALKHHAENQALTRTIVLEKGLGV